MLHFSIYYWSTSLNKWISDLQAGILLLYNLSIFYGLFWEHIYNLIAEINYYFLTIFIKQQKHVYHVRRNKTCISVPTYESRFYSSSAISVPYHFLQLTIPEISNSNCHRPNRCCILQHDERIISRIWYYWTLFLNFFIFLWSSL